MILNNRSIDYLSRETSDCIKGIFALFVVACHLRGRLPFLNETILGQAFTVLGYLSVAVFFFFSGYGLMISTIKKGESYIKNLPRKRILPFYCNYLIVLIIYIVFNILMKKDIDALILVKSFVFGDTLVAGGWYLQSILFIYILFYGILSLFKNRRLLFISLGILLYCIICIFVVKSTLLYESILAFLLGVCWAQYREHIDRILSNTKSYTMFLVFSLLLFGVTLILGNAIVSYDLLRIPLKMISAVMFVFVVLAVVMKINLNNFLTRKLGLIYFEIYVCHGICLELYHSKYLYISNDLLYIVAVLFSTFVIAIAAHQLFKLTNKLFKRA